MLTLSKSTTRPGISVAIDSRAQPQASVQTKIYSLDPSKGMGSCHLEVGHLLLSRYRFDVWRSPRRRPRDSDFKARRSGIGFLAAN
eukprot:4170946-Pleurochrysis_carterae.AAC.1